MPTMIPNKPILNLYISLVLFLGINLSFGQSTTHEKLITLAKTYSSFMFQNEPTKEIISGLKQKVSTDVMEANQFITETITTKNKLLSPNFLKRPNNDVLKQIYIVRRISLNLSEENQLDNTKLVDSLVSKEIPVYELVDNYYEMLFMGVGNKNQPFNFSKVNFKLEDYNLKDDTERGIFFLECMNLCGTSIWGYINIPKPPNTKKALEFIQKFPHFNGLPYYQYSDFYFADFEMIMDKEKGVESYKKYYLNKYFETLLHHLFCLNKENASEKDKNDLVLGSILRKSNLYKYTQYKETLEGIFSEYKKE